MNSFPNANNKYSVYEGVAFHDLHMHMLLYQKLLMKSNALHVNLWVVMKFNKLFLRTQYSPE